MRKLEPSTIVKPIQQAFTARLIVGFCLFVVVVAVRSVEVPPLSGVHAHYVVLGQAPSGDPVALARVVLDPGYKCPAISDGEYQYEMVSRQNYQNFEVIVCEALIEFEQAFTLLFADGRLGLPVAMSNPGTIAVIGNTGCENGLPGSSDGCAIEELAEPFASLAEGIAASQPDLILHTGNFNFRGTPDRVLFTETSGGVTRQIEESTYKAGAATSKEQSCEQDEDSQFFSQLSPASNSPDTWSAWRDDFFAAAGPALSVAPWVTTRGIRELCSRAGAGWYYFLDAHSPLVPGSRQVSCPAHEEGASAHENALMTFPYAIDFTTFSLVVFDSPNACSSFTNDHFAGLTEQQMGGLQKLATQRERVWMLTHMPVWGVTAPEAETTASCDGGGEYACLNQTMQAALRAAMPGDFPDSIELILAGNVQQFQAVSFDGSRPPTLLVGNSGSKLTADGPVGLFPVSIDGATAQVLATRNTISTPQGLKSGHGYLEVKMGESGDWSARLLNPTEAITVAECGASLLSSGSVCQLATGNDARASGKIAPQSIISEPLQ